MTCVLEVLFHLQGKNVKCSHKKTNHKTAGYSNSLLSENIRWYSNYAITEDFLNLIGVSILARIKDHEGVFDQDGGK